MKVLIIGSGGREHALAWKISQSSHVKKLYCAPGNGGTSSIAKNISIKDSDIKGLLEFALKEKIDLTVVGPELPLVLGIVDEFEKDGLKIFGPRKNAAELEGSKIFAKQFMWRHKIPTAHSRIVESPDQAKEILATPEFSYPLVIKADGLAGGKGAIICKSPKKAEETIQALMVEKKLGDAGNRVLIEEYLEGKEASFIVLTDGVKMLPLVTTMDHKAIYDGDKGPNTGGMGAISPSPFIGKEIFNDVINSIVFRTITRMLEEGRKYKGVLYVGLMLTDSGPRVLEFNCRFGDPETQPQVLRMKTDLVEILMAAVEGNILQKEIEWSQNAGGCVVLASGGYPVKYDTGKKIEGLSDALEIPGITIFHAGTRKEGEEYFTTSGRVLNVCAAEKTLKKTMNKIYDAISKIYFEAMHYRRDIGATK